MTSKVALGEMKHVDPRTIWPNEQQDFTPWLLENLDKLGAALGLELEADEREGDVGDFSVDIVAHEVGSNRRVVVENQLEATDHKHLGQLLTYAAGRNAGVVVWISPDFRDEHREVLEWLNRDGEDRPEFFGVELKVLQIDGSKPAIDLRLVAFPSDWDRSGPDVSERRRKYQTFFQGLLDELRQKKFSNAKAAQPQSWYFFASGTTGYQYCARFAAGGRVTAELYIDLKDTAANKAAFDKLSEDKTAIEAAFGEALNWERLDDRRACRICVYRDGSIDDAAETLGAHRAWMAEKLVKLKAVLGPRIG